MHLLLGIDLCEVPRIEAALTRWGERFLGRVFGPGEIRGHRSPAAFARHVAGRFAAKEAAMKALGTGWRGVAFREIAIARDARGKPLLTLHGRALARARELRVTAAEVSITHTGPIAAAVVALIASDEPDSP